MIFPPAYWVLVPCVAQARSEKALRRSRQLESISPVFAVSSIWEKDFLAPSMSRSTAEAFNTVCCLDRNGKLDDVLQDKKQKGATSLLRDELHKQDFAGPISSRASRVLGPISRYRVADILPRIKFASRASRLGLTVGCLRILCNVPCTAQDFKLKVKNKRVELDVRMNPTSLSHHNECPLLYNVCTSIWRSGLRCFHTEALFSMT